MKPSATILISAAAALLASQQHAATLTHPLLEFTYADEPRAQEAAPDVQQCGYYLLIRGTIGHSSGFRPGASVELRGDTLATTVDLYRAHDLDLRDWRLARWTLRVGALGPQVYQVTVATGGKVLAQQAAQLNFRSEGCAA